MMSSSTPGMPMSPKPRNMSVQRWNRIAASRLRVWPTGIKRTQETEDSNAVQTLQTLKSKIPSVCWPNRLFDVWLNQTFKQVQALDSVDGRLNLARRERPALA